MSVEAAQRWAKETTEEQIHVGSWLWKEPLSLGSKGRRKLERGVQRRSVGSNQLLDVKQGIPTPVCCLDQRQWAQQGTLHGASQQAWWHQGKKGHKA